VGEWKLEERGDLLEEAVGEAAVVEDWDEQVEVSLEEGLTVSVEFEPQRQGLSQEQ
jgi:hypothetical protein